MGRHSKRIAMYEVIGQASLKSAQEKVLKKNFADNAPASDDNSAAEPASEQKPISNWPAKPKPVRCYKDRVEFSFSWQVAVIGILALLAMFLVFYKLGRLRGSAEQVEASAVTKADFKPIKPVLPKTSVRHSLKPTTSPRLVEPMGDNVIVITSYHIESHLVPVKEFFRLYGIETEIKNAGNRYLLVTQNRFDNPEKVGTDGYGMKKRVIAIGANYKPPLGSGFETFGAKPFSDAYGMKID